MTSGRRVFAAFGPNRPTPEREARTPGNLELNEHGMELIRRSDIVDQLRRIPSPTLVVVGGLDPVTPLAASEDIVESMGEGIAQLEVVDAAGHFTWLDAPDAYWPVIVEFVDRAAGRARVNV
jgi:pimeloyl-ACP methyl ester carboxylesterase